MMGNRSAVYAARFHRFAADAEMSEGDDAACSCLMLLATDIATHGRASMLERAQELLRLMDPRNGG
jgi:hypothetical protein